MSTEIEHVEFTRLVVDAAYRAGAAHVHVEWQDTPIQRSKLLHCEDLEFVPAYEVTRYREMTDDNWARLALVGPAFPDLLDDIEPSRIRQASMSLREKIRFYLQAQMSSQFQWCVAGVPTVAWAKQVFPEETDEEAVQKLWELIFYVCRINEPDPIVAWQQHDHELNKIVDFMAAKQVRSIHFVDTEIAADGKPNTDLVVPLTEHPNWIAASSDTPGGINFFANIPTEEVFTTPDGRGTTGWVRTSKPTFPWHREVNGAYFRFEAGEVVEYSAEKGKAVLDEFFDIEGTRRLGEVSLVDERSPINQAGLLFHEILFDENAVCHIAFGQAYSEGVAGSEEMSEEALKALGVNESVEHVDFMIGTSTMNVTGICADGGEVTIMEQGRFTDEILK